MLKMGSLFDFEPLKAEISSNYWTLVEKMEISAILPAGYRGKKRSPGRFFANKLIFFFRLTWEGLPEYPGSFSLSAEHS